MDRWEEEHGMVVRFVVGHSPDARLEADMNAEEAEHRDLLRLPTTVRTRHTLRATRITTRTVHMLSRGIAVPYSLPN